MDKSKQPAAGALTVWNPCSTVEVWSNGKIDGVRTGSAATGEPGHTATKSSTVSGWVGLVSRVKTNVSTFVCFESVVSNSVRALV
jgi:hypothetical protein